MGEQLGEQLVHHESGGIIADLPQRRHDCGCALLEEHGRQPREPGHTVDA